MCCTTFLKTLHYRKTHVKTFHLRYINSAYKSIEQAATIDVAQAVFARAYKYVGRLGSRGIVTDFNRMYIHAKLKTKLRTRKAQSSVETPTSETGLPPENQKYLDNMKVQIAKGTHTKAYELMFEVLGYLRCLLDSKVLSAAEHSRRFAEFGRFYRDTLLWSYSTRFKDG